MANGVLSTDGSWRDIRVWQTDRIAPETLHCRCEFHAVYGLP